MNCRSALCAVGIDEYTSYQTLACCVADARQITTDFRDRLPGLEFTLITSNGLPDSGADKASIRAAIDRMGGLGLCESDLVFFYFAGHGFSINGRDYLVCSDTLRSDPESAIATDYVMAALHKSGAGTAVVIVDACRIKEERDSSFFGMQTAELARRQGIIVFFGCSPLEVSQELPKIGHGVFTQALLESFRAVNPTPWEIDKYAIARVRELCAQNKLKDQTPYTCIAPLQKAVLNIFTGGVVALPATGRRKCILLLGPSNSGKTTFGQYFASKYGYVHIEMSSFVWQRRQRNLGFPGAVPEFIEQVWRQEGKDIIAKDLLASAPEAEKVFVCGARTVEEIELLRSQDWNCQTIFLYASSSVRYERYVKSGQMKTYDLGYRDLVSRDFRELSWGLARAATMPDVELIINHDGLDEAVEQVARLTGDLKGQ
ncbi:MAG TPA: caspase family protein [Bryobacteraceae bacterium]|nr:caspase family protein [Bryobacteraceae bacterium]